MRAYIQISLLLVLLVFISSCVGPNKTKVQEDSTLASTSASDSAIEVVQPVYGKFDSVYADPLFFVDGQLCQHLRRIFQDSRGDLWFGTNVYGLMHYNGDSLEYSAEYEELGTGRITGIVEDKGGDIWFGAYGGLSKYDGRTFSHFSEKDGLLNKEIWSLMIDRNELLWIGTNEGLSRFDGKEFSTFPIPKATVSDTTTIYSYDRITCIMEDMNGTIWFGTDGFGICKYDGNRFTHLTMEDGLPSNAIGSIMQDSKGNIWIGTYFGGISRYNGEAFTNFTESGTVSGVEVTGIYEDSAENIWFAAEGYGVYRYDGKSFSNFQEKEGLATSGILSILEDKEGRFWFGGWGGLFRYDGTSFFSISKEGPWGE